MPILNLTSPASESKQRFYLQQQLAGKEALGRAHIARGQFAESETERQFARSEASKARSQQAEMFNVTLQGSQVQQLQQALTGFAAFNANRVNARQARHDKPGFFESGGSGAVGAVGGAIAGGFLAAPTGGLSIPVGMAIGGGVGGAAGGIADAAFAGGQGAPNMAPYINNMQDAMMGLAQFQNANSTYQQHQNLSGGQNAPGTAFSQQSMLSPQQVPSTPWLNDPNYRTFGLK